MARNNDLGDVLIEVIKIVAIVIIGFVILSALASLL